MLISVIDFLTEHYIEKRDITVTDNIYILQKINHSSRISLQKIIDILFNFYEVI